MMLPDCMQEPSEPCAGYTAQSASIAALEAELAERTRERDSWRRVAERLERGVQRRAQASFWAGTELAKWKKEAHLLADKLMKRDAELAAERTRWKDAENLLEAAALFLSDSKSKLARNVEVNIKAHFARYKD